MPAISKQAYFAAISAECSIKGEGHWGVTNIAGKIGKYQNTVKPVLSRHPRGTL